MQHHKMISYYVLFLFIIFASCRKSEIKPEDFHAWLHDMENGLIREKVIKGFKITALYLPPEYLVMKEIKSLPFVPGEDQTDSLFNYYQNNLTFMLTIAPEKKGENKDVMFFEVFNETAYKKRVQEMNFNIDSYVRLQTGGNTLYPVLHNFENTYGLTPYRNIHLVFQNDADLTGNDTVELIFEDQIFLTGISHFVFEGKQMTDIPGIRMKNGLEIKNNK